MGEAEAGMGEAAREPEAGMGDAQARDKAAESRAEAAKARADQPCGTKIIRAAKFRD